MVEEGVTAKAVDEEVEDGAAEAGSRILHSKTRRVKFDRTGVVSSKLANGKKVVNHLRSNKNIRKTRNPRR